MKGCRPLKDDEISRVLAAFGGELAPRNRAFAVLGLCSGFRCSELLSLRVGDVYQHGGLVARVEVQRRNMKRKRAGRIVVLHPWAAKAVEAWLGVLRAHGWARPHHVLFRSWQHGGIHGHAIGRKHAWRILRRAADAVGLTGKIGTHSLRKTFAERVHTANGGDLRQTQEALGHESVASTASYIGEKREVVEATILGMWEDQ